jgi:hypothetical protein
MGKRTAERVEDRDAEASGALDFDLVQIAGELRGQAARRARAIRPAAQAVPDQGRARPHRKPAPVDHATSPLRDRTHMVAAGRIVWPLQTIAAVRCVTPQRPSRSMENEHECGVRAMIRCWHAGRVAVGCAGVERKRPGSRNLFLRGSRRRPATGVERTGEAARALPNAMRLPLMSLFVHANNEHE